MALVVCCCLLQLLSLQRSRSECAEPAHLMYLLYALIRIRISCDRSSVDVTRHSQTLSLSLVTSLSALAAVAAIAYVLYFRSNFKSSSLRFALLLSLPLALPVGWLRLLKEVCGYEPISKHVSLWFSTAATLLALWKRRATFSPSFACGSSSKIKFHLHSVSGRRYNLRVY